MNHQIAGHCHCRSVRVILETAQSAQALPLRACQCSFCRTRGAITTADPAGHLFVEAAPGSLNTYRFGLQITDFLLCDECGTYVAATMQIDGRPMAVVNVRGTQPHERRPGIERIEHRPDVLRALHADPEREERRCFLLVEPDREQVPT